MFREICRDPKKQYSNGSISGEDVGYSNTSQQLCVTFCQCQRTSFGILIASVESSTSIPPPAARIICVGAVHRNLARHEPNFLTLVLVFMVYQPDQHCIVLDNAFFFLATTKMVLLCCLLVKYTLQIVCAKNLPERSAIFLSFANHICYTFRYKYFTCLSNILPFLM